MPFHFVWLYRAINSVELSFSLSGVISKLISFFNGAKNFHFLGNLKISFHLYNRTSTFCFRGFSRYSVPNAQPNYFFTFRVMNAGKKQEKQQSLKYMCTGFVSLKNTKKKERI